MSSLKYLNLESCSPGNLHDVWLHNSDSLDAHRATVKARLLVKRYPLGASSYAGKKKQDRCELCHEKEETTEHLLVECKSLEKKRRSHIKKLRTLVFESTRKMPEEDDPLLKITCWN